MQAKDALPLTAAQNAVRYQGCGFALVGDRCHAWAFGNARYRSRPISVRDSRPSFSATRQRRIKYATSRASKCFASEILRPIRRKVTSSCGLSSALRSRSMACLQAHVRWKAWAQIGGESRHGRRRRFQGCWPPDREAGGRAGGASRPRSASAVSADGYSSAATGATTAVTRVGRSREDQELSFGRIPLLNCDLQGKSSTLAMLLQA